MKYFLHSAASRIALAAALGCGLAGPAFAALITQTQSTSFPGLNGTASLLFNGFNTSLGTLTGVNVILTVSETLTNNVINTTAGPLVIGSPSPLTATQTTTLTGPSSLTATATLATPGFTGTVNPGLTQVGTVSLSNFTVSAAPASIVPYIGGFNTVNLSLVSSGSQGGSVPIDGLGQPQVFTSNGGSATVVAEIDYTYTEAPPPPPVMEPASLAVLGAGLVGLGAVRRRRAG